jgi:hypothetical protein
MPRIFIVILVNHRYKPIDLYRSVFLELTLVIIAQHRGLVALLKMFYNY